MRNCPNCKKRLIKGETASDGEAEVTELLCRRCGSRFADIKIPTKELFGNGEKKN